MAGRSLGVLIVGGSGFLGSRLAWKLREEHRVVTLYHSRHVPIPGVLSLPVNLSKEGWLKRILFTIRPEVVVYLAGSPDPMVAEENIRAMESVHAGGPAEVFSAGEILQPKFLYVSTAYVFDGARGNYREDDTVLPANSLGKAKLAGENFIRTRSLNHTIVRSAPILGQGNGRRLTFLDTLREKLERKEACFCDGTELFNFTLVEPVVDLLARLVSQSPKKGLLHLGGLAKMTVFEVAKLFAGSVGYDPNLIVEKRQMTAINAYKRPDFSLNCTQAIQKFHFETPPIKFSN